jgi:uncharacterized membrane protein YphA (DoxX/SURF4 family)
MKKYKIMFWVTTGLIFLTQGVMEVLMLNNEGAKVGITHLGYPLYFFTMLVAFKALGALALIIPKVPAKIKEWAYAGFTFDFIAAFISIWAVDGFNVGLISPIVGLVILYISYKSYHKIKS